MRQAVVSDDVGQPSAHLPGRFERPGRLGESLDGRLKLGGRFGDLDDVFGHGIAESRASVGRPLTRQVLLFRRLRLGLCAVGRRREGLVAVLGVLFLILLVFLMTKRVIHPSPDLRTNLTFLLIVVGLLFSAADLVDRDKRSFPALAGLYLALIGAAMVGPDFWGLTGWFARFVAAAILGLLIIALPTYWYLAFHRSTGGATPDLAVSPNTDSEVGDEEPDVDG